VDVVATTHWMNVDNRLLLSLERIRIHWLRNSAVIELVSSSRKCSGGALLHELVLSLDAIPTLIACPHLPWIELHDAVVDLYWVEEGLVRPFGAPELRPSFLSHAS
jgi:hypothetical protein